MVDNPDNINKVCTMVNHIINTSDKNNSYNAIEKKTLSIQTRANSCGETSSRRLFQERKIYS